MLIKILLIKFLFLLALLVVLALELFRSLRSNMRSPDDEDEWPAMPSVRTEQEGARRHDNRRLP